MCEFQYQGKMCSYTCTFKPVLKLFLKDIVVALWIVLIDLKNDLNHIHLFSEHIAMKKICKHTMNTHIQIHTHTHIHTRVHTHTYTHIHVHTYMYTHTHAYIHTHTHTYMYVHTYTRTHIHTHTCMYTHTHVHTYNTHTYNVHVHMPFILQSIYHIAILILIEGGIPWRVEGGGSVHGRWREVPHGRRCIHYL